MRDSHTCTKCEHNRLLYISNVPDRGARMDRKIFGAIDGHDFEEDYKNWCIAAGPNADQSAMIGYGWVSAYICRSCGYTELYTQDPSKIPIDGTWVKEVVGPDKQGPFR